MHLMHPNYWQITIVCECVYVRGVASLPMNIDVAEVGLMLNFVYSQDLGADINFTIVHTSSKEI